MEKEEILGIPPIREDGYALLSAGIFLLRRPAWTLSPIDDRNWNCREHTVPGVGVIFSRLLRPLTDFQQLAETLRQIYGLPSNRPIEPAAHLGLPFVKRSYTPQWLAYGPDSMTGSLYFSQRVVELFVEAGIKGVEFFPVEPPNLIDENFRGPRLP